MQKPNLSDSAAVFGFYAFLVLLSPYLLARMIRDSLRRRCPLHGVPLTTRLSSALSEYRLRETPEEARERRGFFPLADSVTVWTVDGWRERYCSVCNEEWTQRVGRQQMPKSPEEIQAVDAAAEQELRALEVRLGLAPEGRIDEEQ